MKTQFDEMPVYAPTDSGEAMEAIGFRIQAFASGQGDKTAIIFEGDDGEVTQPLDEAEPKAHDDNTRAEVP